jgi:hypothetical protein
MTTMAKLRDEGIIWIDDSEIYVAAKSLFVTGEEFLRAVIAHISGLVAAHSEDEAGWWIVPNYDEYKNKVTTSHMVHRINSDWHDNPFWELCDEPEHGATEVWFIDFGWRRIG